MPGADPATVMPVKDQVEDRDIRVQAKSPDHFLRLAVQLKDIVALERPQSPQPVFNDPDIGADRPLPPLKALDPFIYNAVMAGVGKIIKARSGGDKHFVLFVKPDPAPLVIAEEGWRRRTR